MSLLLLPLRTAGHLCCVLVLLTGAAWCWLFDRSFRLLARIIQRLTLASLDIDGVVLHSPRQAQPPVYVKGSHIVGLPESGDQLVDAPATLAAAGRSGEDLLVATRRLIESEFGARQPDLLAPDFQFVFPVVGPLDKRQFLEAFTGFDLREAFPSARGNFFGLTIDPLEPNRVWFFSRAWMRHTGTLKFGPIQCPASGLELETAPQVLSCSFDEHGLVYKLTGGYCVDRTTGDTDGLGGVFGLIHALGYSLPFPEGRPWRPSLEWEALVKHLPQIGLDWRKAGLAADPKTA